MENGLVERVNSLEKSFENGVLDSNSMTKTHILSILDDAGYKKLNGHNDVYHKISHNSVDYVGFNYKKQNKMYHLRLNDFNEGQTFIKALNSFNSYDASSEKTGLGFTSTTLGAFAGLVVSVLIMNPIPLFVGAGLGLGIYHKTLKNIPLEEEKRRKTKLEQHKEISTGYDALKSAVNQ